MNIRELPRRADGLPVIKATYLGWLSHYSAEPGYFCAVITYGEAHTRAGKNFHFFILRALGLDKPWLRIESAWDLGNGDANARLAEAEKLAVWPDGARHE